MLICTQLYMYASVSFSLFFKPESLSWGWEQANQSTSELIKLITVNLLSFKFERSSSQVQDVE